ncbi:metalloendopeptidase OMA1, mitochondrial-like [Rhopalosiphum maidis]|uniref:metalloendopeptidase OMA1, mitochondrial-like n=1 Tax=Rhopalosiphum maidis TaxID=43146 RepID=UPI000F008536|nr:metalloendopeptidase OMA1, mitochondrial-like [Rhopalosiphum maidis]
MFSRFILRNSSVLRIPTARSMNISTISSYSRMSGLICKTPNPMLKIPKQTLQFQNHVCQPKRREFSLLLTVIGGITARRWWFKQMPEKKQKLADTAWAYRKAIGMTVATGLGLVGTFLSSFMELDSWTNLRRLYIFNDQALEKSADHQVAIILNSAKQCCLLSKEHPTYKRVAGVASRLLNANANVDMIRNYKWNIVVLDSPHIINAFVMTNGYIFVYTGLAKIANDDQLAIIIGHELAHCLLRHLNNDISVNLAMHVLFVLPITAVLTVLLPFSKALLAIMFCQMVLYVGVKLTRKRAYEVEADRVGLELAANACVDVTQGYLFWKFMSVINSPSREIWWMETHPTDLSRAQHLHSLIPAAKELQKKAGC